MGWYDACARTTAGAVQCRAVSFFERPALAPPPMHDVAQIEVGQDFVCLRGAAGEMRPLTIETWLLHGDRARRQYRWAAHGYVLVRREPDIMLPRRR